jgi:hypothetical protein
MVSAHVVILVPFLVRNLTVLKPIEMSSLEILSRVLRNSEISNSKHQIPMKSQMSMSNDPNRFDILNFGHCDFFIICYLLFAIWNFSPKLKRFLFDQTGGGSQMQG